MIVEQSEKKKNKVIHKGKSLKQTKEDDKMLLSDLIGQMNLKNKKPDDEDKKPSTELWNYLDQS